MTHLTKTHPPLLSLAREQLPQTPSEQGFSKKEKKVGKRG